MMCALAVVARRTLAYLFPSKPPDLTADAYAATQTPARGPGGEAGPWVGHAPESGTATPRPPAVHPEVLLNYRPHPAHRYEFDDRKLAALLDQWRRELA